jgi:hypothetical protein
VVGVLRHQEVRAQAGIEQRTLDQLRRQLRAAHASLGLARISVLGPHDHLLEEHRRPVAELDRGLLADALQWRAVGGHLLLGRQIDLLALLGQALRQQHALALGWAGLGCDRRLGRHLLLDHLDISRAEQAELIGVLRGTAEALAHERSDLKLQLLESGLEAGQGLARQLVRLALGGMRLTLRNEGGAPVDQTVVRAVVDGIEHPAMLA